MPIKGKGYGQARPGRTDVGGNTPNARPQRVAQVGGNSPNTGSNKGQKHAFQGGNYASGAKFNR